MARLSGQKLHLFAAGLLLASSASPQNTQVAATPPMGWNSWDAYGLTITEAQFRDNAAVLRDKLLPFGWQYAVIDEGWYFENPEDRPRPDTLRYAIDPNGRYVPVPARFPSTGTNPHVTAYEGPKPKLAATMEDTSFAALSRWVHAQGLLFGMHIVRGIPRVSVERNLPIEGSAFHAPEAADETDTCPWDPTNWGVKDNAAGQAWYDSLMRQYAAWGVDLLKVDCIANHPYKADEIRMIRRAINKAGRPMVLSLSPGPTDLAHAAEVTALSNMWRISDDFWDVWAPQDPSSTAGFPQSVTRQFTNTAAWAKYAGPGHWPDADMLPLGELRPVPGWGRPRATRLSPDEQHTLMTLWAMARSPLILGANLTLLDQPTFQLLTNRDVIRVDQTSTGSRQAFREGDLVGWTSDLPQGGKAVALFNLGDQPATVHRAFADLIPGTSGRKWHVRNAWTNSNAADPAGFSGTLPAHGCVLLLLK